MDSWRYLYLNEGELLHSGLYLTGNVDRLCDTDGLSDRYT